MEKLTPEQIDEKRKMLTFFIEYKKYLTRKINELKKELGMK